MSVGGKYSRNEQLKESAIHEPKAALLDIPRACLTMGVSCSSDYECGFTNAPRLNEKDDIQQGKCTDDGDDAEVDVCLVRKREKRKPRNV